MAISKDFKIKLTVENKSQKPLTQVAQSSVVASTHTAHLEQQMLLLSEAMKTAQLQMGGLNIAYMEAAKHSQVYTQVASQHSEVLATQSTALQTTAKSVETIAGAMRGAIATVADLVQIMQALTQPENMKRLSNFLMILAAVSKLKGNFAMAEGLEKAAHQIRDFSGKLEEFRKEGGENFESTAKKAELFLDVTDKLEKGAKLAAVTAGIVLLGKAVQVALPGANNRFETMNNTMGKVGEIARKAYLSLEQFTTLRGVIRQADELGTSLGNAGTAMINFSRDANKGERVLGSLSKGFLAVANMTERMGLSMARSATIIAGWADNLVASGRAFYLLSPLLRSVVHTLDIFSEGLLIVSDHMLTATNASRGAASMFDNMRKNLPTVNKALDYTGQFFRMFGNIIKGVGTDLMNMGSILKNVTTATAPLLGRFGQGIAVISGLSAGFVGLGYAIMQSDSVMAKMAGGSLIALGVHLGGILAVVKALSGAIGALVQKAGASLFTFFDRGIDLAKEDELVNRRLAETITFLAGSAGAASVALERWSGVVERVTQNSALAGGEVEQLAISVARMGQEFKISQEQQEQLAMAIAVFAKNGQNAQEITHALRIAFNGQAKQAEELGIHINELAVNQSAYAKTLGKSHDNMTKNEQVQARLSLLFSQAEKQTKALAATGLALADVQYRVKVASEEVAAQFAQSSIPWYRKFAEIQLFFYQTLLALPQGLKNFINTMTTATGAVLFGVGAVIKWMFIIGGAMGLYTALNTLVMQSAAAQGILTTAFTITNRAMGAQVVAVTSLAGVFTNLNLLLRGSIVAALASVRTMLIAATKVVLSFTAALLANPMFWAGIALAAGIAATVRAVRELVNEVSFLRKGFTELASAFNFLDGKIGESSKTWELLKDIISDVFDVIKNLTKALMGTMVAGLLFFARGVLVVRKAFASTDEAAKDFAMRILEIDMNIGELRKNVIASLSGLDPFGPMVLSAKSAAVSTFNARQELQEFKQAMVSLADINADALRVDVLGNEFERAHARAIQALTESNAALDRYNLAEEKTEELTKNLRQTREQAAREWLNLQKLQIDTVKEYQDALSKMAIEEAKARYGAVAGITAQRNADLKAFNERVAQMKRVYKLSKDQISVLDNMRDAIERTASVQIAEEERKHAEEQLRIVDEFMTRNRELQMQLQGKHGETISQIREQLQFENQLIDSKLFQLSLEGKLTNEIIRAAEEQKRLNALIAESKIDDIGFFESINFADIAKGLSSAFKSAKSGLSSLFKEGIDFGAVGASLNFDTVWNGLREAGKAAGDYLKEAGTHVLNKLGEITLADVGNAIATAFDWGANLLKGILSGDYLNQFADIIESLGNMPEKLIAAMDRVIMALMNFIGKIPQMIEKLLQAIPKFVDKFVEMLPKFVDQLAAIIPKIMDSMGEQLPRISDAILKAIPKIIAMIPRITEEMFKQLPIAVEQIMKALPSIVDAIFKAIPEIFRQLFEMIPTLIEAFLGQLDKFVLAFVEGFIGAIGEIVAAFIDVFITQGGGERIVLSIIKAIPKLILAIVQGLARGLWKLFESIGGALKRFLSGGSWKKPKWIEELPGNIETAADELGKKLAKSSSQIFSVSAFQDPAQGGFTSEILQEQVTKFKDAMEKVVKGWWERMREKVGDAVAWFKELGSKIWDGFLEPIGDWFQAQGGRIAEAFKQWIANEVEFWKGVGGWISEGWKNTVDWFKEQGGKIAEAFKQYIQDKIDFWKDVGGKIFEGFKNVLGGLDDIFKNFGKNLSNGFKEVFSWPALPSFSWPEMPKLRFSTGGPVPMLYASQGAFVSKGTDTVPAMLTPGEFVIRREAVQALGLDTMRLLNKGILPISDEIKAIIERVFGMAGGGFKPLALSGGGSVSFGEGTNFMSARPSIHSLGLTPRMPSGTSPVGGQGGITIEKIEINARTNLDADAIRREVVPAIERHLKRASLDGQKIIAKTGVRS